MTELNIKTYNSKKVLNWYEQLQSITPIEKHIFEKYASCIMSGKLLDIGIGGGRTTRYLIDVCKAYIGIDYSEGFVHSVKALYPKTDIRLTDARDLSSFEENTFDFVNFSFNGIDYVDLHDRERIFKEIHRILKPEGLFFFSTHNMDHISFNVNPWRNQRDNFLTRTKTYLKLAPFYIRHLINKTKETYAEQYAIINDSAHNYSLMTFYTSPGFITHQLTAHHFYDLALYSKKGKEDNYEKLDDWIFVTCRKLLI